MTQYPALRNAALWCIKAGIPIRDELLANLASVGIGVKALQDYSNAMTREVLIYLNVLRVHPGLAGGEFGVNFAGVIERGLNEAWRLGMRENNATEMLEEWQAIVDEAIASERTHISDFAAYLVQVVGNTADTGAAIAQARSRLEMWINRYEDLRHQAIIASADEKTKLIWQVGPTEHCQDCAQLDGMVAFAREWEQAQIRPQDKMLACHGFKCQCSLTPTNERHTRGALEKLMRIHEAQIRR
jgi:hypothetical protein